MTGRYSFVCEKCGKTVSCNSDPSKWKSKVCMDCRNKATSTPKVQASTRYTPPTKSFDLMTYISEMVVVYKAIKDVCKEEGLEIPEANLAQWTTSIMIAKDRG